MATWVSKRGKLFPARERIALENKSDKAIKYNGEIIEPGMQFMYDGPDRQALKELSESGEDHLGQDFIDSNEFLQMVHESRFKGDVDAYLKSVRYDFDKDEEDFEKRAVEVSSHEIPKKVNEINIMGGGRDMSQGSQGTNDVIGGFGDFRERPKSELKKAPKAKNK
jgi:hypothetical protein